jgi:hypothetical protein
MRKQNKCRSIKEPVPAVAWPSWAFLDFLQQQMRAASGSGVGKAGRRRQKQRVCNFRMLRKYSGPSKGRQRSPGRTEAKSKSSLAEDVAVALQCAPGLLYILMLLNQ